MKRKPIEFKVHLEGDSPFTNFCRSKLATKDASVLKLLQEFEAKAQVCVFCNTSFDPATPGTCEVLHDNEDDDEDIRCITCGRELDDGAPLGEPDSNVCYAGSHCSSYPGSHCPRAEWSEDE